MSIVHARLLELSSLGFRHILEDAIYILSGEGDGISRERSQFVSWDLWELVKEAEIGATVSQSKTLTADAKKIQGLKTYMALKELTRVKNVRTFEEGLSAMERVLGDVCFNTPPPTGLRRKALVFLRNLLEAIKRPRP